MDEVHDFCVRVLGFGDAAAEVAREVTADGGRDRVELLAAAARACRARPDSEPVVEVPADDLAGAVAAELSAASARLPERQREALALREGLRLSHEQIAAIVGIEETAVAPLLARARLALRAVRRGGERASSCPDRDRALRVIARRQDSEPIAGEDDDWLLTHLGGCDGCSRDHAAMLEAAACYRAWTVASGVAAGGAGSGG
jgi:hypothetical protein